jgi:hypothetical protein
VELWSAVVTTPDFTVQVASMVGIGVGIDYALFIVTRYREALHRGTPTVVQAAVEAIDTAGRAVVFAGVTVMISLLGMLLMGIVVPATAWRWAPRALSRGGARGAHAAARALGVRRPPHRPAVGAPPP